MCMRVTSSLTRSHMLLCVRSAQAYFERMLAARSASANKQAYMSASRINDGITLFTNVAVVLQNAFNAGNAVVASTDFVLQLMPMRLFEDVVEVGDASLDARARRRPVVVVTRAARFVRGAARRASFVTYDKALAPAIRRRRKA